MFHRTTYRLLLGLGVLGSFAIPGAYAADRHDRVRDAQRELREDTRDARRELREDLRRANDRRDVRQAYRDYNENLRDARRDYRDDVSGYSYGRPITNLPYGYQRYSWGGRDYYYHEGSYYQPGRGGYVTVRPPVGAVVGGLPGGAHFVNLRGERLYYANGVYYRPIGPSRFVVVNP